MGRHVRGIDEEKRPASRSLFVPDYDRISNVGTHTRERRKLRGYARTKRKPFVLKARSGHVMLARRQGKKRLPLTILGHLSSEVDITPELDALAIIARTVRREFPPIYERLLLRWAEGRRG